MRITLDAEKIGVMGFGVGGEIAAILGMMGDNTGTGRQFGKCRSAAPLSRHLLIWRVR
jgi:hypothetical protein